MQNDDVKWLLGREWPEWTHIRIDPLRGAGGFSGAAFWRLTTLQGQLHCLRRWPAEHPGLQRLLFIHAVLRDASAHNCSFVPAPLPTRQQTTYAEHAGHFWELTRWMPGKADFHPRNDPQKLRAALTALARFHEATALSPHSPTRRGPSPGLQSRLELLHQLRAASTTQLPQAISRRPQTARLDELARHLLREFEPLAVGIVPQLKAAAAVAVALQPCIRDIWHDHVLFTGTEVTGIVDFGAMNIDAVATDIARLLGSLVGDDEAAWCEGLLAYEAVRPLTTEQRRLIGVFDRSNVVLSGMNWLRWLYLEGRQFEDLHRVEQRLENTLERMQRLAQRL